MKFIDDIQKLMYSDNLTFEDRSKLNHIIFEFDKHRAKNPQEIINAGKEWHYRLRRLCDYLANK